MENRDQDSVMSVEGLSLDFKLRKGIFHAVRDVSFQIRRGQTLCLVGESGSGKSVTARSLMQIVDSPGRIAQGRITLRADGREIDIAALDPKGKEVRKRRGAKIGLIFQEPMSALSPFHTIGNQIDEVNLIHT